MSCSDCLNYTQSAKEMFGRLFPGGISPYPLPLSGSLELTLKCNVRCSHCYILYPGATDHEMSTEQVKTILQKLCDGGVMQLLLTGGEVFTRPDFEELYMHAKRLGFIVSVYTNATLVNQHLIDLFTQYPPWSIEVTMYGHTEETYEKVTGVKGSFKRYRRGLELMFAAKLPVKLKTMVLNSNQHEFEDMRDWAVEHTQNFDFDINVSPRLDKNDDVLSERLSPSDYVKISLKGEGFKEHYHGQMEHSVKNIHETNDMFTCGYGVKTFHVDPTGKLHPCMLWRENPYDLLNNDLDENWRKYVWGLRKQNTEGGCNSCSQQVSCGRCPAASMLEMGDATKPIPYFCEVTAERQKTFGKYEALDIEFIK